MNTWLILRILHSSSGLLILISCLILLVRLIGACAKAETPNAPACRRVRVWMLLAWAGLLGTFVTGYAIVFGLYGSMAALPPLLHIMATLGIIMAVLLFYAQLLPCRAIGGKTQHARRALVQLRLSLGALFLCALIASLLPFAI